MKACKSSNIHQVQLPTGHKYDSLKGDEEEDSNFILNIKEWKKDHIHVLHDL